MNTGKRKRWGGTAGLLCALALAALPAAAGAQITAAEEIDKGTINLLVNQEHPIDLEVIRINVGNASIAKVVQTPDLKRVMITAKSVGTTDLRLVPKDKPNLLYKYTIIVMATDIKQLKVTVEELVGDMLGVEVSIKGGNELVVDGQVLKREDRARLNRIVQKYGLFDLTEDKFSEIEDTAKQREQEKMEQKLIEDIKKDLRQQKLLVTFKDADGKEYESINVEMKDIRGQRHLYLTGEVFSDAALAKVNTIVALYYGEKGAVTNMITAENPVIEIEVQMASVDQQKAKEVGSNTLWNSLMKVRIDGILYNSETNAWTDPTFFIGEGANTSLRLLNNLGATKYYKVQSQATKSGTEADFNMGGELVFITQGETPSLQKIEYGFKVKVTPTIDETGKVNMNLEVEDSQPIQREANVTDQAAVSLSKFKKSTNIDVPSGQTIVLSGFDADTVTQTEQSTPFLSKIPIINIFFKAKQRQAQKVRSFLLLTPTSAKYFQKDVPDLSAIAQKFKEETREETQGDVDSVKEKPKKWYNPFTWF